MVRETARRGLQQHVIVAGPPGTSAAELPPLAPEQVSPILFPTADAPFSVPGNSDVMPYQTTVFSRMTDLQVQQYLAVSRRVMEAVRAAFRPQIVHAHHLWLMTALAREVFNDVPMVATSHNAELRQMIKAPHLAPQVLPGVQAINKICVLTQQSVSDTVECFGVSPDRIVVTGAGFRDDLFRVSREPRSDILADLRQQCGLALPEDETIRLVTFVGRLSTPKGIPFLLKAAASLERGAPPFRILLVGASGSGEDGKKMDELVASAGSLVLHLGAQPPEIVAKLLQVSDVFILPSLFEGLPLTMLEALACGCPAIVTGLPTVQSWVPESWQEAGFVELVPPLSTTLADEPVSTDVQRFVVDVAAALRRYLTGDNSLGRRHSFAAEMFPHTWSEVFKRYEQVYDELLRDRLPAERVLHGGTQQ
jgi:glycosyltransferase involved in cell wall biosynthesis